VNQCHSTPCSNAARWRGGKNFARKDRQFPKASGMEDVTRVTWVAHFDSKLWNILKLWPFVSICVLCWLCCATLDVLTMRGKSLLRPQIWFCWSVAKASWSFCPADIISIPPDVIQHQIHWFYMVTLYTHIDSSLTFDKKWCIFFIGDFFCCRGAMLQGATELGPNSPSAIGVALEQCPRFVSRTQSKDPDTSRYCISWYIHIDIDSHECMIHHSIQLNVDKDTFVIFCDSLHIQYLSFDTIMLYYATLCYIIVSLHSLYTCT
jgi:hypothetical protein